MSRITTVLGDIDSSELGFCQPHEHLYMVSTKLLIHENPWFQLNNLPLSIQELQLYKKAGGCAVMDPNPLATGRNALDMADMSRESGVHLIACTGFHIPSLFYGDEHWIMQTDADTLRNIYMAELNEGMYVGECYRFPEVQTSICAGALKAAITAGEGERIDPKTRLLLKTVGEAGVCAGAPVMVHTECGFGAMEAIDILEATGMDPAHIIICHIDRRKWDMEYYEELSRRGTYLEYDTVNQEFLNEQTWITDLIITRLKRGEEDRMLISLDTMNDRLKTYGGEMGLDYLLETYIPLLKGRGVTDQQIQKIFVDNPAKALSRYQ